MISARAEQEPSHFVGLLALRLSSAARRPPLAFTQLCGLRKFRLLQGLCFVGVRVVLLVHIVLATALAALTEL